MEDGSAIGSVAAAGVWDKLGLAGGEQAVIVRANTNNNGPVSWTLGLVFISFFETVIPRFS